MFNIKNKLSKQCDDMIAPRFKFLSEFTKEYNNQFEPKVKLLFSNEGGFYFEEFELGFLISPDYQKNNFYLKIKDKKTNTIYDANKILDQLNYSLKKYNIKLII